MVELDHQSLNEDVNALRKLVLEKYETIHASTSGEIIKNKRSSISFATIKISSQRISLALLTLKMSNRILLGARRSCDADVFDPFRR